MDIKLMECQAIEIMNSAFNSGLVGIRTFSFEESKNWLVECTAFSHYQKDTTYFEFETRSQARRFQRLLNYNGLTSYIFVNRDFHAHA